MELIAVFGKRAWKTELKFPSSKGCPSSGLRKKSFGKIDSSQE
jgi:hypothetical protein